MTCDICGRTFGRTDGKGERLLGGDDMWEAQEMVSIQTRGGYGSIFGDGASVEIIMCQHCLKEKLGPWLRIGESELDRMAASVGFEPTKRK